MDELVKGTMTAQAGQGQDSDNRSMLLDGQHNSDIGQSADTKRAAHVMLLSSPCRKAVAAIAGVTQ